MFLRELYWPHIGRGYTASVAGLDGSRGLSRCRWQLRMRMFFPPLSLFPKRLGQPGRSAVAASLPWLIEKAWA
jgi:hypothetical protein